MWGQLRAETSASVLALWNLRKNHICNAAESGSARSMICPGCALDLQQQRPLASTVGWMCLSKKKSSEARHTGTTHFTCFVSGRHQQTKKIIVWEVPVPNPDIRTSYRVTSSGGSISPPRMITAVINADGRHTDGTQRCTLHLWCSRLLFTSFLLTLANGHI